MLVPDFYPQKVTIVNGLYQSLMVMQQCQGYDPVSYTHLRAHET